MSNEIVPFGKYKGHHVEELLRDSSYLEWCLANGVIQKYPSILQIVNNYNVIPNDTPEHNAMQIKYFEKAWQMAFLKCVHPELFKGEQKLFYLNGKDAEEEIKELQKKYRPFLNAEYEAKERELISNHQCQIEYAFKDSDITFDVEAEVVGMDIHLLVSLSAETFRLNKRKYYIYDQKEFFIELKPTMGDDYPAVLRQVKSCMANKIQRRIRNPILIVGDFCGKGAEWNQVVNLFAASGINALLESQIVNEQNT